MTLFHPGTMLLKFLLLVRRKQRHDFGIHARSNDSEFRVNRSELCALLSDGALVDRTCDDGILQSRSRRALLFPE